MTGVMVRLVKPSVLGRYRESSLRYGYRSRMASIGKGSVAEMFHCLYGLQCVCTLTFVRTLLHTVGHCVELGQFPREKRTHVVVQHVSLFPQEKKAEANLMTSSECRRSSPLSCPIAKVKPWRKESQSSIDRVKNSLYPLFIRGIPKHKI